MSRSENPVRQRTGKSSAVAISRDKTIVHLDRLIYWGLMAQVLLLPLAHTATPLTIAMVVSVLAFLLKALLGGIRFRPTAMELPFAFFIAATLVSTFSSVDRLETLDQIRSDVIIPMANFYLVAWGLTERRQILGLGRAAVVILGILSAYGIAHFFWAGGSLASYLYREASLSEDFHYLGTYLVVVLPFVLATAVAEQSRFWKRAAWAVAAITPMGIYITFDRGCWLALAVIWLAACPLVLKNLRLHLTTLAVAAIAVILIIPSGVLVHGKWIGVWHGRAIEANTLSQRLVVWTYCWRCLVQEPFTGIGFGRENFKLAYADFVNYYAKFQLFHCHNTYFDLALQIGLLGLIGFIIMALTGLKMAYSIWRRAGPAGLWGGAGILCLAGFLVRIVWDSLYLDEHARVLWLMMGLVFAAGRVLGRDENHQTERGS